ncbi:hypothetical protein STEG23_016017 [Scotinomys teguina]
MRRGPKLNAKLRAAFLNGWLRPALDLAPRHPSSLIVASIFTPHPARLSPFPALLKPGEGSRRDSGGGAGSPGLGSRSGCGPESSSDSGPGPGSSRGARSSSRGGSSSGACSRDLLLCRRRRRRPRRFLYRLSPARCA